MSLEESMTYTGVISARALKVLTEYLVGRTGVQYFETDTSTVCAAAASLRPPISERDLLQIHGCGRSLCKEIKRALAQFQPLPRPELDWTHLDVTFRLRVIPGEEAYMLDRLREALDHLLACKPLMGVLVVSSVNVIKIKENS
jgi:hypothetical protein